MDTDIFIGEFLRRQREDLGIELKFISQRTKINLNILKKLEASALDELPNRTYVKSFVQHYAREINIEQSQALKVLDYTYENYDFKNGTKSNQTVLRTNFLEDSDAPSTQRNNKFLKNNKVVITAVVTLFVAIGLLLIIRNTQKSVQVTRVLDVPTPTLSLSDLTQMTPTQNPTAVISPQVTPVKTAVAITPTMAPKIAPPTPIGTINIKITPTIKPTSTVSATSTPTPKTTIKVVETSPPTPTVLATIANVKENFAPVELKKITGDLFKPIKDAPELKNPDIVPTNIRNAMTASNQNVYINSVDSDTWLTYKVDSNPVKGFTLGKGRTLFLRGKEIRLFLGRTSGAKVFYNNQMVQFDSKTGVKSLVFPPSESTKYSLPLFIRDKMGKIHTSEEYQEVMKGH